MDDADKTIEKSGRTEKDFCPPGTSIERTRIPGTNQSNVRCKTSGSVDVGNQSTNRTGQGGNPGGSTTSGTRAQQDYHQNKVIQQFKNQLATDKNKKADENNFDSAGREIKIGDTVGGSDMQPPTVKQPPSTQQQPSTQQPSTTKTKKRRYRNIHPEEYAYEFILDKLISEGHASSLTEAEYVFKQLDDEYIESMLSEQNLSYSDATAILKNHQYDKAQLMKMSRKATETGQHGLAQACYDAACKMKI